MVLVESGCGDYKSGGGRVGHRNHTLFFFILLLSSLLFFFSLLLFRNQLERGKGIQPVKGITPIGSMTMGDR